jgi:hypothetical protein
MVTAPLDFILSRVLCWADTVGAEIKPATMTNRENIVLLLIRLTSLIQRLGISIFSNTNKILLKLIKYLNPYLMQGSRHDQGKLRNISLKELCIFGDTKILTTHSARWGGQGCPTGVLKMLSGTQ